MYGYCRDANDLRLSLQALVRQGDKSLAETIAKLSRGGETRFHEAQHHLSWQAVNLVVEMTHARHATDLLAWLPTDEQLAESDKTRESADELWYYNVQQAALRRCMRSTNPASRSTSPASNAAEDAELSFWQKMLEATHRL